MPCVDCTRASTDHNHSRHQLLEAARLTTAPVPMAESQSPASTFLNQKNVALIVGVAQVRLADLSNRFPNLRIFLCRELQLDPIIPFPATNHIVHAHGGSEI